MLALNLKPVIGRVQSSLEFDTAAGTASALSPLGSCHS